MYGTNEYIKIREICKKIGEKLQNKIDEEYMNRIWSFLDACVEKYKNYGRITVPEVDLFFNENNIEGSTTVKNMFRAKVNEMIQNELYGKHISVKDDADIEIEKTSSNTLKWI